jgi:glycosyltransferase involved in cell wall biosynthesis
VAHLLLYVAYPMRLDLGAANGIQTYDTVRELQRALPGTRLVVPRWLREPSRYAELGALHLPRPAANKLSKFLPWGGWSYIERTLFALMLVILLACWRVLGRGYRVLYVRDSVCAAWLSLLQPVHGGSVIYEVHDLESLHPSKASKWPRSFWSRFLPWLDNAAIRRPRKLVSLTETFKTWAVEHGRRAADVTVVPDAFNPAMYGALSTADAREQLGVQAGAFIVGYAGLTFAYRRLDLLVEAFAILSRQVDNALLLLVGGRPSEQAEIKTQAAKLGISARVILAGAVPHEEAARYVQASDVLVIPDTVTGMTASPLKLFEYLGAGKPVVLKDMPALREIVSDDCAIFFPEGDAYALAEGLRKLYDSPALRDALGACALDRSRLYTYRARAEKIADVVKSCL